jgi:hypothetical protein
MDLREIGRNWWMRWWTFGFWRQELISLTLVYKSSHIPIKTSKAEWLWTIRLQQIRIRQDQYITLAIPPWRAR